MALAIIVGVLATTSSLAYAASTGGISGQVTNAAGTRALSDADVNVYDQEGDWLAETTTNHLGDYSVAGLAPGDYKVSFRAD